MKLSIKNGVSLILLYDSEAGLYEQVIVVVDHRCFHRIFMSWGEYGILSTEFETCTARMRTSLATISERITD